jgi:hypothetical protein
MEAKIENCETDTSVPYKIMNLDNFLNKIIFNKEDISKIKSFSIYHKDHNEIDHKICETMITEELEYPIFPNGEKIFCFAHLFNKDNNSFKIIFDTEKKNLSFKLVYEYNSKKTQELSVQMSNNRYIKTVIGDKKILYHGGFVYTYDLKDPIEDKCKA